MRTRHHFTSLVKLLHILSIVLQLLQLLKRRLRHARPGYGLLELLLEKLLLILLEEWLQLCIRCPLAKLRNLTNGLHKLLRLLRLHRTLKPAMYHHLRRKKLLLLAHRHGLLHHVLRTLRRWRRRGDHVMMCHTWRILTKGRGDVVLIAMGGRSSCMIAGGSVMTTRG